MKEYIIKIDEDKKDIMGNCPLVEKPQELIRCKDCKNRFDGCCYDRKSDRINFGVYVKDDWFCADGVKRE